MSDSPSRTVERLVPGRPTTDGAGVKLIRALTGEMQIRLDPFLMLDEFHTENPDDYIGGFPPHPHRGFETVTYMLAGNMRHRDNAGGEGVLRSGGVQWMTAGRGIIHEEMPMQEDGLMQGFQLWLNLPAKDKMIAPAYQDIQAADIPVWDIEGVQYKLVAGQLGDYRGPIQKPITEPLYVDITLAPSSTATVPVPVTHNAFLYVFAGEATVGDDARLAKRQHLTVLSTQPEQTQVAITAPKGARLLLIAGKPLKEPIAQWGPFVMNTRAETETAMQDYREGRF